MLRYLISSHIRLQLLRSLWVENRAGTASALARHVRAPYAAAHRELEAMARAGLSRREVEHGAAVWRANRWHPAAGVFEALLKVGDSPLPVPMAAAADDAAVRAELRALGNAGIDRELTLVRALELARRDAGVARTLPASLWQWRAQLDWPRLETLAHERRLKHTLGFMLDLTGLLGGDDKLRARARRHRDGRVHRPRDFFTGAVSAAALAMPGDARVAAVARRWGFRLELEPMPVRG
jgi:hypothetical protein